MLWRHFGKGLLSYDLDKLFLFSPFSSGDIVSKRYIEGKRIFLDMWYDKMELKDWQQLEK